MKTISILTAIGVWMLQSCGSTHRVATADVPEKRFLPPLPESSINIPVKIYMPPLLQVMDSGTSTQFTNSGWPDYTQSGCDFRYKYLFIRSPFQFSCINNRVQIGFDGKYQIAGSRCVCAFDKQVSPWVGGSCGFGSEPMRRVHVQIASYLNFLPNHQVQTNTHIDQVMAFDKCQVTVLSNDITGEVMDSIKASVESYCNSFDRFVQDLNQNPFLTRWRSGANRVMPVSHYGYLNLNPSTYRIGPLNTIGDTLGFHIGFTGMPAFSSDSIDLAAAFSLPPISQAPMAQGLTAFFNARLSYNYLNKLLNDSLQNKPVEVEGRTFVIRRIQVSGTPGGRLAIDLSFTGNKTAVLHLSGTPVLDSAAQVMSMPDLDFSLDSRDMLLNMAKGLFRKKILKQLKGQSVFDLAALFKANQQVINQRLNQPVTEWMNTYGHIDSIRVLAVLADDQQLQLQFMVKGELGLLASPPASLLYGF